jgi:catalase
MTAGEKTRLVNNLVGALKVVPRDIQIRQISHFYKVDPDYGNRVAAGLGINIDVVIGKAA